MGRMGSGLGRVVWHRCDKGATFSVLLLFAVFGHSFRQRNMTSAWTVELQNKVLCKNAEARAAHIQKGSEDIGDNFNSNSINTNNRSSRKLSSLHLAQQSQILMHLGKRHDRLSGGVQGADGQGPPRACSLITGEAPAADAMRNTKQPP